MSKPLIFIWVSEWVSEWLLLNGNSAVLQLYRGENKLIVNEMMIRSALQIAAASNKQHFIRRWQLGGFWKLTICENIYTSSPLCGNQNPSSCLLYLHDLLPLTFFKTENIQNKNQLLFLQVFHETKNEYGSLFELFIREDIQFLLLSLIHFKLNIQSKIVVLSGFFDH
jgi:hypothetical protein